MRQHNKLVRDKIIETIEGKGQQAEYHIATEEEFRLKATEKLVEEVKEFANSKDPEELADLLEVIYAIAKSLGIPRRQLDSMRSKKAQRRGAFRSRIILERS